MKSNKCNNYVGISETYSNIRVSQIPELPTVLVYSYDTPRSGVARSISETAWPISKIQTAIQSSDNFVEENQIVFT